MVIHWTENQRNELDDLVSRLDVSVPEDAVLERRRKKTHLRTPDGKEVILKKFAIPERGEPIEYYIEYDTESGEIEHKKFDTFKELKHFIKGWI